jgi:hypothetical protein
MSRWIKLVLLALTLAAPEVLWAGQEATQAGFCCPLPCCSGHAH